MIHQSEFGNRGLQLSCISTAKCVDCQCLTGFGLNPHIKLCRFFGSLTVSKSNLMVYVLDFGRFSTSAVAVCINTCSSEASKVFSAVMVVDKGSVTVFTVSVGFSVGNLLLHRRLW